jgi:hypothetical protein
MGVRSELTFESAGSVRNGGAANGYRSALDQSELHERSPTMTADERLFSSVVSEFARTMLTDFPIQAIIEHLVQRVVDVLPMTGAGVTLIGPALVPRYVAASNSSALQFEEWQTELGDGPCLASFRSGEPVASEPSTCIGIHPVR